MSIRVRPKSKRRQKQAEATRQEILKAARRLFVEQGYAATSMNDIAREAETAVQTIYDSIGPKRAVLLAINDLLDAEAGVPELAVRVYQTDDPREMIGAIVRMMRGFQEFCGDIVPTFFGVTAVEPDVAEMVEQGHARHDGGVRWVISKIEAQGRLRPELDTEHAVAILGGLTWRSALEFVGHYGWSLDDYETRMTDMLCRLLLGDDFPLPKEDPDA